MLKKLVCALGAAAAAVAAGAFWLGAPLPAQIPRARNAPPEAKPDEAVKPAAKLPITQVVMFNSGVGYFQRSGSVEGDARVELALPAGDINDLIKTLVVSDGKAKAAPLRYDSQEPLEKTLKSFGVDLSANPSYGQLINQTRGEKVEVFLGANAANLPATVQGTIVGMESSVSAEPGKPVSEKEFLNLLCADGLRSIPLADIQRVRFLNPVLEAELRRALDVVAGGHDAEKKTVRFAFKGEGKRDVKIAYVAEHPIWKTSYRIRLDGKGKAQFEGWATVDNTSDEDWNDVKLVLVSSRPISYRMDMYAPLNIPRPIVEPELFASLRPPTYSGPLTPGAGIGGIGGIGNTNANDPNAQGNANRAGSNQGLQNTFQGQPNTFQGQSNVNLGGQAGLQGFGGGQLGQYGNLGGPNKYQNNSGFANGDNGLANGKLSYEEFASRRAAEKGRPSAAANEAAQIGGAIAADVDPKLIDAALAAGELGNPARFAIEERIKLPRQQSAMIPLFDLPMEAEPVSIYNPKVQATHPLNGLRIKNPTKQSLMQGPITVVGDEQYVGESRIADLQPGEQRFLSYAVDVGVEVKPYDTVSPSPAMTASVVNGQLTVGYRLRSTRTYAIKNNTPDDKVVVIEQAVRGGWRLLDEKSALETTRDLYRFRVPVKSGALVKYEVKEELPRIDPFQVTRHTNWTGFATTLGLDVWTTNDRAPEEKITVRVDGALTVTHRDRRKITYNFVNRSETERTVELEHFLGLDRKVVGDLKPDPQNRLRYVHTLTLPAAKKDEDPKPVSFALVEENRDTLHEAFPISGMQVMRGQAMAPPAPSGVEELPPVRYITPLGFEIWKREDALPEVLVQGRFVKGILDSTINNRVKQVYTIRNTSDEDRTFLIEQIVPQGSSLAGDPRVAGQGGLRKVFPVLVPAGKIIAQEVVVETKAKRSSTFEGLLALPEETLKNLTSSENLSRPVRQALEKGLGMLLGLRAVEGQLKELAAGVRQTAEEQKRVRDAFEKLPDTVPLYRRYLDKLDKLETEFEQSQASTKKLEADQKAKRAEYDAFVKGLNAE